MKLSEIKPNPDNPRIIRDEHFAKLKKSIQEFPQMMEKRPIVVDENNMILGGNMRFRALQDIYGKNGEIPDKWVSRAAGWTDEQKREFVIKDNAAYGEWDWAALSQEWDTEQLADWTVYMPAEIPQQEETETKEAQEDDFDPDKPVETVCKKGDIWRLGIHRLMCGDSCDIEQVKKLCGGQQVDCWLTDPPYNVALGYEDSASEARQRHRRTDQKVVLNDSMPDADFRQFLVKAYTAAKESMKAGAAYYIFHADNESYNFRGALRDVGGMQLRETLIWVKDALTLGRQDYQWKHEPCLYGWKEGESHKFFNDRKQTTCIEFPRPKRSEEHPTMKPVPLFAYLMANSTKQGDLVLDSFGGSGTTIVAAEQLNRKCYMMELDPHYCDVIIARYEKLTGNKAERIE